MCTDVAARGLDFPEVTTIIQYDPPGEASECALFPSQNHIPFIVVTPCHMTVPSLLVFRAHAHT